MLDGDAVTKGTRPVLPKEQNDEALEAVAGREVPGVKVREQGGVGLGAGLVATEVPLKAHRGAHVEVLVTTALTLGTRLLQELVAGQEPGARGGWGGWEEGNFL